MRAPGGYPPFEGADQSSTYTVTTQQGDAVVTPNKPGKKPAAQPVQDLEQPQSVVPEVQDEQDKTTE